MKSTKSFHKSLIKSLKDPIEAANYLNAILKEGDIELLMVGLRDVAEALGGMSRLSQKTRLNRGHLYKILSNKSNPGIYVIENVLKAVGLRFAVVPNTDKKKFKRAA